MTGRDPNLIEFCVCSEGPYHGAQKLGTPPRCERCGFVPNDPWVHAALLDLLARAGALPKGHAQWEYGIEYEKAYNNFVPTIEWGGSYGISHTYEYTEENVHALAGGRPVWRRLRTRYRDVLGEPERWER